MFRFSACHGLQNLTKIFNGNLESEWKKLSTLQNHIGHYSGKTIYHYKLAKGEQTVYIKS